MIENKKVLVTGGAGAIGSNLVAELIKHNCTVYVLDDLSSGYVDIVPNDPRVHLIIGSILDDKILDDIFQKKIDIVYHLAAFFANQNSVDHPEADLSVNILGTLKVLQRASKHKVQRFVYTGTSCVYGTTTNAIESTTDFHLDTPYAISKLTGEKYVLQYNELYGLSAVVVRFFNSFGPGEKPGKYRNVIPNFIWKAMNNEPLTIYGTGDETRDFNWMGNAVQALILAGTKEGIEGEIFNIGSGKETKIKDLAEVINRVVGNKTPIEYIPRRKWDTITRRVANVSKTKKVLGYVPDVGGFEDKIRQTYEWVKKHARPKPLSSITLISPRPWHAQWGQEKELIYILNEHYNLSVLELYDSQGHTSGLSIPKNTNVIFRKTSIKNTFILGLLNEFSNLRKTLFSKSKVIITYVASGSILTLLFARVLGKKTVFILSEDIDSLLGMKSFFSKKVSSFFTKIAIKLANKSVGQTYELCDLISKSGKKPIYVPYAVDMQRNLPSTFENTNKIGYVGSLGDWLDIDLIDHLLKSFKEKEFYFVGDGSKFSVLSKLSKKHSNLVLVKSVDESEIDKLIVSFDACIFPFKKSAYTDKLMPLRFLDFMARKKVVISSDLKELKRVSKDASLFSKTKSEFVQNISKVYNLEFADSLKNRAFDLASKYDIELLRSDYHKLVE
ncbi:NAD-dependent epimerase/dehydratase family protein [Candidatus Woesearchaeota archaeon]|nr:NAD-dependent epimerase/dehydratase family protein [Candidatus Woesearchaeota archaeon]